MRNAIIEIGGSGTPIDINKYRESVEYWKERVIVLRTDE